MKATDETKAKAKELGIEKYWVKAEETLQDEIDALDSGAEPEQTPKPEKKKEKLTLPTDITEHLMRFSINVKADKSPYWKYKDLL